MYLPWIHWDTISEFIIKYSYMKPNKYNACDGVHVIYIQLWYDRMWYTGWCNSPQLTFTEDRCHQVLGVLVFLMNSTGSLILHTMISKPTWRTLWQILCLGFPPLALYHLYCEASLSLSSEELFRLCHIWPLHQTMQTILISQYTLRREAWHPTHSWHCDLFEGSVTNKYSVRDLESLSFSLKVPDSKIPARFQDS